MQINDKQIRRRGALFIVSGPSGAGKTSVCAPALRQLEDVEMSVSHTTRTKRVGESDGIDYCFVADAEFTRMVDAGEFAEWAEVHGFRYGTSKRMIESARSAGRDLLLDVDVQGAEQLKRLYPDAVTIFLLPPSSHGLEQRLRRRGTDSHDTVGARLRNACKEIERLASYDYVIVNDRLEAAVATFLAIVRAERARVSRIISDDLVALCRSFDQPK